MKSKLLLTLFLAFVTLSVNAQTFTTNWQKDNSAYPNMVNASDNLNTGAYNPITDKLYVAARGAGIYVIDPATGAWTNSKMLSSVGIALVGQTGYDKFNYSKIATTSAGEIFAVSLSTTGTPKIYYWANEDADPVLVSGDIVWQGERAGDSFALTGSGDDVVLYVGSGSSSAGGQYIQVIKRDLADGKKLKKHRYIDLAVAVGVGPARGSISPIGTGELASMWISGPGLVKKRLKYNGYIEKEILNRDPLVGGNYVVPNTISKHFLVFKYFEVGAEQFIATTGALSTVTSGEALAFHIYNITDLENDNITLVAETKLTNTLQDNFVPTADIDFKKTVNGDGSVTMQFFQIVNHNAFASHTITFPGTLPVSLSSFNASLVNNQSQLNWSTASELNNAGFEIESSQDGVTFTKIGFVASKASNSNGNLNYSFKDNLAKSGTTYYRLKQLDLDGKSSYSAVKFINNTLSVNNSIAVYPNPTADFIEVGGLEMEGVTFALFNTNGTQVDSNGLVDGNRLSLASFTPGIYILKISKNGELVQTSKVVKN